jgi:hypothetical protein
LVLGSHSGGSRSCICGLESEQRQRTDRAERHLNHLQHNDDRHDQWHDRCGVNHSACGDWLSNRWLGRLNNDAGGVPEDNESVVRYRSRTTTNTTTGSAGPSLPVPLRVSHGLTAKTLKGSETSAVSGLPAHSEHMQLARSKRVEQFKSALPNGRSPKNGGPTIDRRELRENLSGHRGTCASI